MTITGKPVLKSIMAQSNFTKVIDATGLDADIPAGNIGVSVLGTLDRVFATVANAGMAAAFDSVHATNTQVNVNAENGLYLTEPTV